jgi:type IX secretion system PorP/SprF family membrane protein
MKKLFIYIFSLVSFVILAQELNLPPQAQYLADNPAMITPTFAGIGDNFRIRLNGMSQWVGIKNAPINQSLAADFRIADTDGIGLIFYNDKNGNTRQYGAKASYAHHLILDWNTEQYLSLGLSFNLNHFRIETSNFDQTIFDPFVTDNRYNQNYNLDLGALYRKGDFWAAVNASNILDKNTDKFFRAEPSKLRNYQLYSGYKFRGKDSNTELEPSVLYQYFQSDKRSSTDVNFKARFYNYEDYYWAGITARFINDQSFKPLTVGPMAGLKKNNFYAAYSYEITTNQLAGYNSGTHVITLGFDFLQNASNCPCTQKRIVY